MLTGLFFSFIVGLFTNWRFSNYVMNAVNFPGGSQPFNLLILLAVTVLPFCVFVFFGRRIVLFAEFKSLVFSIYFSAFIGSFFGLLVTQLIFWRQSIPLFWLLSNIVFPALYYP
jgi:hypothetical protein